MSTHAEDLCSGAEPDLLVRSLLQRMSFPRADVPRIERATLALLADVEADVPKITFGRSYLGVCSAGKHCCCVASFKPSIPDRPACRCVPRA